MKWILILLISFAALGDSGVKELAGFDAAQDVIADDIIAGAFLIYDCNEGHWTCVIKENFNECAEKNQKGKKYSCAPIGEFPSKKSCFQRQLYMVGQNYGNRFCVSGR